MTTVLIGHTGFVGSNLATSHAFDLCVNSKTIGDLLGGNFDTVVCAGVSAVKWKANENPDADAEGIARLTDVLDTIRARRMILISTVDVLKTPNGQDEKADPDKDGLHAYGLHRLQLEQWLAARFDKTHVLRLPALFGPGLRKNIIFDLLNDNMLDVINPESRFQWYPTTRLWSDIQTTISSDLPLVHLATEPVATSDILAAHFPDKTVGTAAAPQASYDFQTSHAAAFGANGCYMMHRDQVLAELGSYLSGART